MLKIVGSRHLFLEGINDENILQLYKWRNSKTFLNFLTSRPKLKSINDFKKELYQDFINDRHLQLLIYYRNKPVGTIYSYSYNKFDNFCFISVYLKKSLKNSGIGVKAVYVFLKYLFEHFKLYKIYFDIYSTNYRLVLALQKRNIKIEGRFLNQHVFKGTRHDVIRFAVYSNDIVNFFPHK